MRVRFPVHPASVAALALREDGARVASSVLPVFSSVLLRVSISHCLVAASAALGRSAKKEPLADRSESDQRSAMKVEVEKEEDGRWIAEVPALPGAMAYGASKKEAVAKVEALVLRVLADKIEHGEEAPELSRVFTVAA